MLALLSLFALTPDAKGQLDAKFTMDMVESAWRRREVNARSGKFIWSEVRVMSRTPADLKSGPFDPREGSEPEGKRQTLQHKYRMEYSFEGDKLRYFSSMPPMRGSSSGEFRASDTTFTFDGRITKDCFVPTISDAFPFQGAISAKPPTDVFSLLQLNVLFWNFRPFRQNPDFLTVLGLHVDRPRLNGRSCVVIAREYRGGREAFWLDSEHDFVILRHTRSYGEITLAQTDIEYEDDPAFGPIPASWKCILNLPTGQFNMSFEAITATRILNEDIPDSEFDLVFPVNTLVIDNTHVENGNAQKYIVREDNRRRVVLPEEYRRTKTASELIATETGMAGLGSVAPNRMPMAIAAGIVIAIAIVSILVFIRRRRWAA